MKKDAIEMMKFIIRQYNQFDPNSQLYRDIQSVTGCKTSEIADIADSHCNMISTWAIMRASRLTQMSYKDFFSACLITDIKAKDYTSKGCEDNGRILVGKEYLIPAIFGVPFNPVFYENFEDVVNPETRLKENCFYQLKIKETDHYIACGVDKGILMIFDTGRRGVNVPAIGANRIDQRHFKWLLEFPEAA